MLDRCVRAATTSDSFETVLSPRHRPRNVEGHETDSCGLTSATVADRVGNAKADSFMRAGNRLATGSVLKSR